MWGNLYVTEVAGLFFVLLGLGALMLPIKVSDILGVFVLTFALFFGFRAFLLVSGLDVPDPEGLFPPASTDAMLTTSLLWLSLFLVVFGLSALFVLRLGGSTTAIFVRKDPPLKRLLAVTVTLTVLASAITVTMVVHFGGVGTMLRAVKVENELAGLYVLKVPAAIGAVLGVATFLDIRRSKGPKTWRYTALVCCAVDAACSLAWGQRSVTAVVLALLVIGMLEGAKRPTGFLRPRTIGMVILAALLVAVTAFGLRIWRDTATRGEAQAQISQGSIWRRVSVATNSESLDRSMLIFRDWPAVYDYRDGTDFTKGAVSFVPRLVWPGKPTGVRTGPAFRQVYQPQTVNGWPPQAPMDWYLNFGPLGFIIHAMLAGAVFGFLSGAQRRASLSALNMVIAMVAAIYVFRLGLPTDTTGRFVSHLLPLIVLGRFLSMRRSLPRFDPDQPHVETHARSPVPR